MPTIAAQPERESHSVDFTGVYIVLAAFNEEQVIGEVVAELKNVYDHVIVVDDCSTDETGKVAARAGAKVLRHIANRGQGAALQTGITYSLRCQASQIVTFDSDGQHSVEDIPNLLAPILCGKADIVLGSRFLGATKNMPTARRILIKAAVLFTRFTAHMFVTDTHNGMRAFSRRAAERLCLRMDRMAHASEILEQVRDMGLSYIEQPVTIRYTRYSCTKGQSSLNAFGIIMDYMFRKMTK